MRTTLGALASFNEDEKMILTRCEQRLFRAITPYMCAHTSDTLGVVNC
jgi:hypothetical protein